MTSLTLKQYFCFKKCYEVYFGNIIIRQLTNRIRYKMDCIIKCREDPVVIKLDSQEFKNIFNQEVVDLKKIFDEYNYEIRIAGGAVRDLLMGQPAKDLDFATTATPDQMKEMFTKENIRMVNMGGEKHGTITPRINDKENFEVTTLRIDLITDGRHAEVEFTTDWKLDANRRDLTINSMFLGFDGSVYDYFYGYDDLLKKRIAFVGDTDTRIKEDYLRILRYFRFFGKLSDNPNNHDKETLDIIRCNVDGLKNISGERICTELKKILKGNFAIEILKTMLEVGIGKYSGFPENNDYKELDSVVHKGNHLDLHHMAYIAALMKNIDEMTTLHARLKFTNFERDMAYFIIMNRELPLDRRPLLAYEKLILLSKINVNDSIKYVTELLKYKGESELLKQFEQWKIPKFPITGKDLKENNIQPSKTYGIMMSKLKDAWIDSDYKHTKEDLLKLLTELMEK